MKIILLDKQECEVHEFEDEEGTIGDEDLIAYIPEGKYYTYFDLGGEDENEWMKFKEASIVAVNVRLIQQDVKSTEITR